jgi:PqqD family protein of HPr-rel-A system
LFENPSPRRWRAVSPDRLHWEMLGETTAVFSAATGETHLLNELPAEVLRELGCADHPSDELAEILAGRCELESNEEWRAKIGGIVASLQALELVYEAP